MNGVYLIIALLGFLVIGNSMHEAGHYIYCQSQGGIASSDFLQQTKCRWQPTDIQIQTMNIVGGFFSALIGIAILLPARKIMWRHREFAAGLIAMVIGQLGAGLGEGLAFDMWMSNIQWIGILIYLLAMAVGVMIVRKRTSSPHTTEQNIQPQ